MSYLKDKFSSMNADYPEESVDLILTVANKCNGHMDRLKLDMVTKISDELKKNRSIWKSWCQGEKNL